MRFLFIILLACLLISCKGNDNFAPGPKNVNLQKYSQVKTFDDLFEQVNIVTIDTSRTAVLGNVRTIRFTNDNKMIFFSLATGMKVFSNTGKFLFDLGRKGGGPGEYISAYFCEVHGQTAYIFDQGQTSLILFNLSDGSYIKNIKLKRQYSTMQFVGDKLYLFCSEYIPKIKFDVMDVKTESVSELELPAPEDAEKLKYLGIMYGISSYKNNLVYCFQSDFKINIFNTETEKIQYRSNRVPPGISMPSLPVEESKRFNLHSTHAGVTKFFVFNNGLIANTYLQLEPSPTGDGKNIVEVVTSLFDDRGNYLSSFENFRNVFCDGEYLYEYLTPIKKDDLNGYLKVYKLKY